MRNFQFSTFNFQFSSGGAPAFDCGEAAKWILMFLIGDNGATGNSV